MVFCNLKHIFIVGTTHSGSTLLYRLIAYHPDLGWFSQYSFRDGSIPGIRKIPFSTVYDIIARKILIHPYTKNTHASIFSRLKTKLAPSPNEGGHIWNHIFPDLKKRYFGPKDVPEVYGRALEIMKIIEDLYGNKRFLAKVPRLAQAVPALSVIFPESLFIHIVRDGKAVAVSPPPPDERDSEKALEFVRERAAYWKETVRWMKKMEIVLGAHRVIHIRYEDLCENPLDNIDRLGKWCDLSSQNNWLSKIPASLSVTNEKRFQKTPEKERKIILEALGEELFRWNYMSY